MRKYCKHAPLPVDCDILCSSKECQETKPAGENGDVHLT